MNDRNQSLLRPLTDGPKNDRVGSDFSVAMNSPLEIHPKEESRWSVFEHARDAMMICSPEGQILKLNGQAARMFGYEQNELVGKRLIQLLPSERPGFSGIPDESSLSVNNYADVPHALTGFRKDGTEVPVEIRLAELNAEEGKLVFGIIRDRTDKLVNEALKRQAEFEKIISALSATFINLPTDRVDEEITNGLNRIANSLGAQRGTLGQLDADSQELVTTHSWAADGIQVFPRRVVRDILPRFVARIEAGEDVFVSRPEALPSEAVAEKAYMEQEGVKSFVAIPCCVAGQAIGGVAFESFHDFRHWDNETVSRLQSVADVFANAITRKQADEKLQNAYTEIQKLKEQLEQENSCLREEIKLEFSHNTVVGNSAAIRLVLKNAEQVASTDTTVLVLGETGTGKELIARTIHELSRCNKRPMVKTNCAALPATLIESELFGREKGAYTGALAREIGRFELANGSTIFLDEIGELPSEVQSKLLRVLQEGEFERLGSSKTIKVNVRVIAATSRNLDAMVKEGKFREDLYYRLNVFPIVIPPLRERVDDIPPLVWHILKEFGKKMGRKIEGIQSSTMRDFQKYSWPGNVRELRNVIERNLILNTGPIFKAEVPQSDGGPHQLQPRRLDQVESEYLRSILQATKWRIRGKGGAAEIIGLKPTTLESRMKKLDIRRPG